MQDKNCDRVIKLDISINADIDSVWETWTTEEGIKTFLAPDCHIDFKVDGAYELYFDPDAEPGNRGTEGMKIMAIQPRKMLAFTWNAPPHLAAVRSQRTHVVIRFDSLPMGKTRMTLYHDGWGEGEEWDNAYEYFTWAWKDLVIPRLIHRFTLGPIDWANLPR